MADREVGTEVRGSSLIISNASNCSLLTAASAHVSISRIDNRDTRMRTRICFDNRFFDYRLTCLAVGNLQELAVQPLLFAIISVDRQQLNMNTFTSVN